MSSQKVTSRKRVPALAGKDGVSVIVRFKPSLITLLDDWIAAPHEPEPPSRPEAIRRLLEEALKG
jgi:hypothetical protein